jgi:hypothetical protein
VGTAGAAAAAATAATAAAAVTSAAIAGGFTVASLAAAGFAAKAQHDAGVIQSAEYKLQAKQAGDAARGREIERKRDLLKALATQAATAGAQGVAMQGSNVAIARADINQSRNDLLTDTANARSQERILRSRAANARSSGNAAAVTSLLGAANTFYQARG